MKSFIWDGPINYSQIEGDMLFLNSCKNVDFMKNLLPGGCIFMNEYAQSESLSSCLSKIHTKKLKLLQKCVCLQPT